MDPENTGKIDITSKKLELYENVLYFLKKGYWFCSAAVKALKETFPEWDCDPMIGSYYEYITGEDFRYLTSNSTKKWLDLIIPEIVPVAKSLNIAVHPTNISWFRIKEDRIKVQEEIIRRLT